MLIFRFITMRFHWECLKFHSLSGLQCTWLVFSFKFLKLSVGKWSINSPFGTRFIDHDFLFRDELFVQQEERTLFSGVCSTNMILRWLKKMLKDLLVMNLNLNLSRKLMNLILNTNTVLILCLVLILVRAKFLFLAQFYFFVLF